MLSMRNWIGAQVGSAKSAKSAKVYGKLSASRPKYLI